MPDNTSNETLRGILEETKTIAAVGVSTNPVRPSYFVVRYLHYRGYNMIPVNPAYAGQKVFGKEVLASLADIPKDQTVDMVEVFRRSEAIPGILDEALEHLAGLKTLWMQFGIYNEDAAETASAAGLRVVQDRCPKIEYQRLFGELRKAGINTGIISAKLPELRP
ncbi:CoA-binding protein [Actibacterium pelagium]|uniref:CoA-binding protein n=1 Tax=Actibacterium pelagium TaxID=2029103 RepID=A0A917AA50_9RHOB|nr:CoA-binding protein [Actibacterium pelagium]GGE37738.1 CoA-binding protein [Actibacterium pelagium]